MKVAKDFQFLEVFNNLILCLCHDLGGGCLAFVVLEHMAFCLTARHVLCCHHGLAPPTLLFYLLILPSHLHSILSSLSPVFKNALVSAVFFCQSVSICYAAPIIFLLLC